MPFFFSRWQKIALVFLIVALLAGVAALMYGRGRLAALDDGDAFFVDVREGEREGHSILVDVSGAVKKPGLYRLPAKARLHEALAKAGGTTKAADVSGLNLAGPLRGGEKVLVPVRGETEVAVVQPEPEGSSIMSPVRPARVPQLDKSAAYPAHAPKQLPNQPLALNSATAERFAQLPGIGPVLAERIVAYRRQLKAKNGRGFESKEQLLEVPGIGPKKYAGLKDFVKL